MFLPVAVALLAGSGFWLDKLSQFCLKAGIWVQLDVADKYYLAAIIIKTGTSFV